MEGNIISELDRIDGERLRLDGSGWLLSDTTGEKGSVTSVIETGDVDLTGSIQGFNRLLSLHFLGDFRGFQSIKIEVAKDGSGSFEAFVDITPDDVEKSLAQVGVDFGDDNVEFGAESPFSRHFEVPMRLGRLSTFRVRWTITAKKPTKLSAVGVYGLTSPGRFFKQGVKFPATR